jgi:hypothetical protein
MAVSTIITTSSITNTYNNFNIFDDKISLFSDLVLYNNENPTYYGDYNIPLSNKYYIILIDQNDQENNNIINYLFNDDREADNPFENINNNIGFDRDQVYQINLLKDNIKQIDNELNNIFINIDESDGELCIVIDIRYLLNIIMLIDEQNEEIHLYDFLINKLNKKLDKILILDSNKLLFNNNELIKPNLLHNEFIKLLKKNQINSHQNTSELKDKDIFIYKKVESIYWKIIQFNKNIILHDDNVIKNEIELFDNFDNKLEDIVFCDIDDTTCMVTKKKLSKILSNNIFNLNYDDEIDVVLHPLSKMNISLSL